MCTCFSFDVQVQVSIHTFCNMTCVLTCSQTLHICGLDSDDGHMHIKIPIYARTHLRTRTLTHAHEKTCWCVQHLPIECIFYRLQDDRMHLLQTPVHSKNFSRHSNNINNSTLKKKIQCGEDSQDLYRSFSPSSVQVILRKSDLYLVALLLKMICNLGDPVSLRRPVPWRFQVWRFRISLLLHLDRKKPPPRGGFLFTMFPDQKPGGRGPPLTPVAGSIFGPLSHTHLSKSEFKNGLISKSCFVFQVIQVFLSRKFYLSFIS